jgi:hypothetical protein
MLKQTLETFLYGRMQGSKLIELGLSQKGNRKVEFCEYTPDFDFNECVEYANWEVFRITINPEGFVLDVQRIG